jgi:non-ribosomal peptide synthetase component E (peptide arylation enzyme)
VPDERLGEEVCATLYISRPVSDPELRTFLEPRLAKFQIPRYFRFTTEPLPRGATGKILKKDIRAQAAKELVGS